MKIQSELESPSVGFDPEHPCLEVITVNDVIDIIEASQMASIFYLTDNFFIWVETNKNLNWKLQHPVQC